MRSVKKTHSLKISLAAFFLAMPIPLFSENYQEKEVEEPWEDDWGEEENTNSWGFSGFVEAGIGDFTKDNKVESSHSLKESRTRLEGSRYYNDYFISLKGDIYADDITAKTSANFREAYLSFSPAKSLDVRAGRQILTWGTGDLVFLNDLFPKDWQSFFSGREQSYLKAPSDAIRLTYYNDAINTDLVWSPEFDSDKTLTGERFSYFNPMAGEVVAAPPRIHSNKPAKTLSKGEIALRLYKTINTKEIALYAYRGFYKQALGFDTHSGRPFFPRLYTLGASIRLPVGSGIGNIEIAHHNSRQDDKGTDPLIPNSQNRFLIAYERELLPRLTLALQYYLEWTRHYNRQKTNSLAPQFETGKRRHLITNRLTYRLKQDKLNLSLFVFLSPDEKDSFIMPKITWRYSDAVTAELGANIFKGEKQETFLGQLEDNSNIYTRVRFTF